jgi:hypothetical protein
MHFFNNSKIADQNEIQTPGYFWPYLLSHDLYEGLFISHGNYFFSLENVPTLEI